MGEVTTARSHSTMKTLFDKNVYAQIGVDNKQLRTDLDAMKKQNVDLLKEIDRLKQNDLDSLRIDAMSMDELNEIKAKLSSKIRAIEEAERDLMDNTLNCIACQDNKKNVSFTNGCDHFVLCDECESAMEIKTCPLCSQPYTSAKKLNV